MARLLVALDAGVGVSPADFARSWGEDKQAAVLGAASVRPAGGEIFLPGLVELVAVPIVVDVASAGISDLVRRLVRRGRPADSSVDLELVDVQTKNGDRVVVVRLRGGSGR
jgi:hypothetical protein